MKLSAAQYKAIIAKWGMTQAESAAFLGVGHRTVGDWLSKDCVPAVVAVLFRYMVAVGVGPDDVRVAIDKRKIR